MSGKSHVLMHARSIGVRQNKEINIKNQFSNTQYVT